LLLSDIISLLASLNPSRTLNETAGFFSISLNYLTTLKESENNAQHVSTRL